MQQRQEKKISLFQILSCLLFVICLGTTVYFFRDHIHTNLDSDEASELVLANLLASEGKLLTKNWYYSSEICILNMNAVYMLFFKMTDKWYRVRLLGTLFVYLLFLLSYYRMSSVYKFKKYFLLSAAVFFIPVSFEYYSFILKSAWYFPYIIYTVIVLILSERFMQADRRRKIILAAFSFLFALFLGSNGARELLVLSIPLLAASIMLLMEKDREPDTKQWFLFSIIVFIGSIIGYLINSRILIKFFEYQTWDDSAFIDFSFTRLERIIKSLLDLCGYQKGSVFSASLLPNAVCMLWIVISVYVILYAVRNRKTVSHAYYRLSVYVLSAFCIFVIFYLFTDTYVRGRYYSPFIVLCIPLTAMFLKESDWNRKLSKCVYLLLVSVTMVSGLFYYYKEWDVRPSLEIRRIAKDLVSMDYYNGYATFWNSNVLTELSNGKIDVWSVADGPVDLKYLTDIDTTYHWLQLVSHDTTHPEGKVFLLIEREETDNPWKDALREEDIIIKTNNYTVYGFESYESLVGQLYPDRDLS